MFNVNKELRIAMVAIGNYDHRGVDESAEFKDIETEVLRTTYVRVCMTYAFVGDLDAAVAAHEEAIRESTLAEAVSEEELQDSMRTMTTTWQRVEALICGMNTTRLYRDRIWEALRLRDEPVLEWGASVVL